VVRFSEVLGGLIAPSVHSGFSLFQIGGMRCSLSPPLLSRLESEHCSRGTRERFSGAWHPRFAEEFEKPVVTCFR